LLSAYGKTKINAWKMFEFYQRPIPKGAQDIGQWQNIFTIISVIATVTNSAMICFTMNVLDQYTLFGRSWIFIGFQWFLITCQFAISEAIPDEPYEVYIQKERREFINEKLIEQIHDDEDDDMAAVESSASAGEAMEKDDEEDEDPEDFVKKFSKKALERMNAAPVMKIGDYPSAGTGSSAWPDATRRSHSTSPHPSPHPYQGLATNEIDVETGKK